MNSGDQCRLCAKQDDLVYIFPRYSDESEIATQIQECMPFVLYKGDPLPQMVCKDCVLKLSIIDNLRKAYCELFPKWISQLSIGESSEQLSAYITQLKKSEKSWKLFRDLEARQTGETNTDNELAASQTNISILTPTTINDKQISLSDNITEKQIFNPMTLLQSSIHVINQMHLGVNYLKEGKYTRKIRPTYKKSKCNRKIGGPFSKRVLNNTQSSEYEEQSSNWLMNCYNSEALTECYSEPVSHNAYETDCTLRLEITEVKSQAEDINNLNHNTVDCKLKVYESEPLLVSKHIKGVKCYYCNMRFLNVHFLSKHELSHMQVNLGVRIDETKQFDRYTSWLYKDSQSNSNQSSQNANQVTTNNNSSLKMLTEPPLLIKREPQPEEDAIDVTKFPSVLVNGQKRKLCSSCNYTFKDNYAVRNHITSGACNFCCKICGKRYRKNSRFFYQHMNEHRAAGHFDVRQKHFKQIPAKLIHSAGTIKTFRKMNSFKGTRLDLPISKPLPRNIPKVKPIILKKLLDGPQKDKQESRRRSLRNSESNKPAPSYAEDVVFSSEIKCKSCPETFFRESEYHIHQVQCSKKNRVSNSNAMNFVEVEMGKGEMSLPPSQKNNKFYCTICNCSFPTMHARNSHMRVHKGSEEYRASPKSNSVTNENLKTISNMPSIVMDQNLALLINNPHITIKTTTSFVKKVNANQPKMTLPQVVKTPALSTVIQRNVSTPTKVTPFPVVKPKLAPKIQTPMATELPAIVNIRSNVTRDDSSSGDFEEPVRKYHCLQCKKAFSNKSLLYKHKKNVCKKSTFYPCPYCNEKFQSPIVYNAHLLRNHPDQ